MEGLVIETSTGTDALSSVPDGSSTPSFDNLYNLGMFMSLIALALIFHKLFRGMFRKLLYGSDSTRS